MGFHVLVFAYIIKATALLPLCHGECWEAGEHFRMPTGCPSGLEVKGKLFQLLFHSQIMLNLKSTAVHFNHILLRDLCQLHFLNKASTWAVEIDFLPEQFVLLEISVESDMQQRCFQKKCAPPTTTSYLRWTRAFVVGKLTPKTWG